MQLISEIIDDLTNTSVNLTTPLLKTQRLAFKLKNTSLIEWTNGELEGYENTDNLPAYRIIRGQLFMEYFNNGYHVTRQEVPLNGLSNENKSFLTTIKFTQSVGEIEALAAAKQSVTIENPLPIGTVRLLEKHLRKTGNSPYLDIISASRSTSSTSANAVLSAVRKRLLTFMIEIEQEFGDQIDVVSWQKKNPQITYHVHNTITNSGHGNVINTGDKTQIDATITISKGDFASLKSQLQQQGVTESDLVELAKVINRDPVDYQSQRFGPGVNAWIQTMVGKALDGSWQIGVATAGGVLTELIKHFYGMGN